MKKLTSVEVCAGAGGQAIGLEKANFHHLACVEMDKQACDTLRLNRPKWRVIETDLRNWEPDASLRDVDLLAGGVPCPPFSLAGRQLGKDDERDLFPEMVRLARALRPRAVMIENVRGILGKKFDEYRAEILEEFKEAGYVSQGWELLNAKDYGVPQSRPRAILVLFREDLDAQFSWPRAKSRTTSVGTVLKPFLAADGWVGAEMWARAAQGIAPALVGGSKKHGGADLGPTRAKAAWRLLGIDGMGLADAPPPPLFEGTPRLTVPMAAAIQGFPKSWKFAGRKTAAYRQVGNAFPPPVAAAVGRQIAATLTTIDGPDPSAPAQLRDHSPSEPHPRA